MITTEEIALDWRTRAVSELVWKKCGNQAGIIQGEAGGYYVTADGFPRRGYLKPANPHPNASITARAAREKIAADLACDLALPVPPVQLTYRDDAPDGCETSVAVSLVMYPTQHAWETIRNIPLEDSPQGLALAQAISHCSPMLAFDTWVAQTDHNDHPHNIVWGYDPCHLHDSKIIFLDFAFSMGFSGEWKNEGWRNISIAGFPRRMMEHLDKRGLRDTIHKISCIDDTQIESIIMRIPQSHLDNHQKEIIYQGLTARKALLNQVFSSII